MTEEQLIRTRMLYPVLGSVQGRKSSTSGEDISDQQIKEKCFLFRCYSAFQKKYFALEIISMNNEIVDIDCFALNSNLQCI